jgi:hypothetical protein
LRLSLDMLLENNMNHLFAIRFAIPDLIIGLMLGLLLGSML